VTERDHSRTWHFGVLPFAGAGHLNPFIALAEELATRGHRVTFFCREKSRDRVRQAGLACDSIPEEQTPRWTLNACNPLDSAGKSTERSSKLWRLLSEVERDLRQLPSILSKSGIEVLLIDDVIVSGPTLAEYLRLPYFLISTTVPHSWWRTFYSWFAGYRHRSPVLELLEVKMLTVSALRIHGPVKRALNRYRRSMGLAPLAHRGISYPPLAQITQMPQGLDSHGGNAVGSIYHAGPFRRKNSQQAVDFPWDELDDRPIVYVGLGTTRHLQHEIIPKVARACDDLAVQLVVSLGDRFNVDDFQGLPGSPLVARFVPQLELLKVAVLVITHCGANTVLESLAEGKPLIAIPITLDQPALAARLVRRNVAIALPVMRLSVRRIRTAISVVMSDPRYRARAIELQKEIRAQRGTEGAALLIEHKLALGGQPLR
jgi:zeaxanthin glucosyltransferase